MTSNATQNVLDESEEDQLPRQQSLRGVLRREGNWKCLLLTTATSGCLAAAAWCQLARVERVVINFAVYPIRRTQQASACEAGYAYLPAALALLLYLVYLVECYHSTARVQLTRRVDVAAVARRVCAMREAAPKVWWKAVCYHYVRRKRQVTRYRNGDAYTTSQVYYERVNTHSATTSFAHACCGHRDASRNLILDARPPITKVRFSKGFAFANIEAASEFEDQRSRFFAEHERFDDFMEMREGLDLVGVSSFKEYMVAYRDADNVPWYSSQLLFWVLSCSLLSWPLRIIVECNTAYVHYTVTKIFGTNYELDSSRRLDLETHLSDFTPPVTTSNYGWVNGNLLLNNDRTAVMANSNGTSSSGSQDGSTQQINILALAARNRSNVDPGVMSHTSTIDSLELFATIRENSALVPSYSEALRIDLMSENREDRQVMTSHTPALVETATFAVNNGPVWMQQACDPQKPNQNRSQPLQVKTRLEKTNDNVIIEELIGSTAQNNDVCDERNESSNCDKRPILEKSLNNPSIQCTKQSAIIRNNKRFFENVIGSHLNKNSYRLMQSTPLKNCSTCNSNDSQIGTVCGERSKIRLSSATKSSIQKQNRYSWTGVVTNCKTDNICTDLIHSKEINKSNPSLSMMRNSSTERLVCADWKESTGVRHSIIQQDSSSVQNFQATEENIYEANGISESIDRNLVNCHDVTEKVSLIYASPLIEVCPDDPFDGRNQTTPTEDPPPYEVAIHLPVLRRITRSITDRGELFGQSRAFITDTILNRRSCIDSIVSETDGVRLLQSTIAEQNRCEVNKETKL